MEAGVRMMQACLHVVQPPLVGVRQGGGTRGSEKPLSNAIIMAVIMAVGARRYVGT